MTTTLTMTEAQLLDAVLEMARLFGYRTAHFRAARTSHGWRTAVSGDGKGFPDLILLRGPRLLAAELKSARGAVTPDQKIWFECLLAAGAEVCVGGQPTGVQGPSRGFCDEGRDDG